MCWPMHVTQPGILRKKVGAIIMAHIELTESLFVVRCQYLSFVAAKLLFNVCCVLSVWYECYLLCAVKISCVSSQLNVFACLF